MKRFLTVSLAFFFSASLVHAQLGKGLSSDDIVSGLKDALSKGTQKSTDKLSAVDGFFKDAAVKILLPPEAAKMEKALRSAGFGPQVDKAIMDINRAAEDAAKSAAPIFLNAIKGMSVSDGIGILQGPDTAATSYLRRSTTVQLTAAFLPVIKNSLDKVGATNSWKTVVDAYNKIPFHSKVNADLPAYTTQRALDGVFYYVAVEEKSIRANPMGQADDLLKKVFGGL
ncbi:MAG TPA: DUF4197 domain-containing protein [Puia sp.]|jgi:hypothetical protein|nr:DUF4197 domain-containing protein [Puia sp.]